MQSTNFSLVLICREEKNKSLNHYSFCYLKCNADSSNLDAANIICESLAISDTLFFYDSTDLKMDNNNNNEQ